ncbi:MAG TPA: alkyl sulfatase dimerization domain-containing protein [Glycomyces sp.]|nr:alkyl sulfatase dimerization domain-containing protein [Glycomyces sp.]
MTADHERSGGPRPSATSLEGLDFTDTQDFADADRGFQARLEPGVVTDARGQVVWDADAFAFLEGEAPQTVNPSLWRQSQLCARQGLYEVCEGVYQVRGLDLSNMTLIEGERGVIAVDPLVSAETAAAALGLYRDARGDRPVTGLIYTHSHIDHFGGVLGVIDPERDRVPIIAPEGFLEHAVEENVYAGPAMLRRAMYYSGAALGVGPEGNVGMGLGPAASHGSSAVVPPTVDVTRTGQEATVDGVRLVFQLTPGTEAPSEMNFHLPQRRALCMAENASHNMHNLLTLRGAVVRDPRVWSRYLNESMLLFAADSDVLFASHHWPTWGADRIRSYLTVQRDLYAYMHDQTLRLINQGLTGTELAERIELPPGLEAAWSARGYYGSLSHNTKAIYQRYMGWFDGHPSSLWEHPPEQSALRYAEAFGGADALVDKGRAFAEAGDDRFAAQLLKHAVFADPSNGEAKELLADAYRRLGLASENGTWRNYYLMGAQELRHGIAPTAVSSSGMAAALTVPQVFDSIAIRVDGPKAAAASLTADWVLTDLDERYRTELSNGVLVHWPSAGGEHAPAEVTFRLTKAELLGLVAGEASAEEIDHDGDPSALGRLLDVLDEPDLDFPIVTP